MACMQGMNAWRARMHACNPELVSESYPLTPKENNPEALNARYGSVNLWHGSIKKDGCDRTRVRIGFVIKLTSQARIDAAYDEYLKMSQGSDLFPTVDRKLVDRESLAASHFMWVLRCCGQKFKSPLLDEPFGVGDDPVLQSFIDAGHDCIELSEDLPAEDAYIMAEYQNADQNQNAMTSYATHIRSLMRISIPLLMKHQQVLVGSLVAAVTRESCCRLNADSIAAYGKWTVRMIPLVGGKCDTCLIDEWLLFMGQEINSQELTCPPKHYEQCAKEVPLKYRYGLLNLCQIQYDTTDMQIMQQPPNIVRFIKSTEITALCGQKEKLDLAEAICIERRERLEQTITERTSKNRWIKLNRVFENQMFRLLMNKGALPDFAPGFTGTPDRKKLMVMQGEWAKWVENVEPLLAGFGASSGLFTESCVSLGEVRGWVVGTGTNQNSLKISLGLL